MRQVHRLSAYDVHPANKPPDDLAAEFERLLAMHERELTAFVFALLPNWADAEDVVQRTRIVLWRKFNQFRAGSSFRSWAFQIARFEVQNFRRTKRGDRHCFDEELVNSLAEVRTSLADEFNSRRALLDDCLRELRASDRQIVHHCYGPTATTAKQAAEKLQRPINTLYKALNRIRRSLLACVQMKLNEGPEQEKEGDK